MVEEKGEKLKRQPDPTPEDRVFLNEIVQSHLGERATGEFFGVMSRGVRGDEGHYGHAVLVVDPDIAERFSQDPVGYPDHLATMSTTITNQIKVAGNVIIDLAGHAFDSKNRE